MKILRLKILFQILTMMFTLSGTQAFASPQRLTYQGRILATDGTPLEYSDVSFRFQITSSSGTCVLYYEQRDHVNMAGSDGIFDISIGDGTVIFATGSSNLLSDSFINGTSLNCYGGGTWTASSTSERLLKVSFKDAVGWKDIDPPSTIRSVPFAMTSYSAQTIADKTINDLVLKATLPSACSGTEVLTWNGSTFTCKTDSTGAGTITGVTAGSGLTGGGTTGTVSLALTTTGVSAGTYGSATQIPTIAVDAQGRISSVSTVTVSGVTPGGSASGDLSGTYPSPTIAADAVTSAKIADGTINSADMDFTGTNSATSGLVIKDSLGKFANFACSTVGHVATWTAVGWACQAPSATDSTKLPLAGGTMAGNIDMDSYNITNVGYMTMSAGKSLHVSNNSSDPSLVAADKGKIWFNSTSNELKYWNGTTAVSLVASGTGSVTSVATGTGLSGGPITSTGTISLANTAVSAGSYGSATQVGTFTVDAQGRLTAAGNTTVTPAWSSITSTPTTLAGYGITDAQSSTLANGKILVGNASNVATAVTVSGDATVANDGTLTLASTGTAGTYYKVTTDAKGRVTSGSASLVASDIPSLPWSKITSGTPTTLSGYGITDAVQNAGGTPSVTTGTSGSKPATGTSGALYVETDTQKIYSGTGSGWTVVGSNSGTGISALTGDVTASGTGSVTATIASSAVTNAKMANMASYTIKANNTGSAAAPTDVTITSLQGTTASTFAAGNDSRITGALQSGATAGGDLSGTYPSPSVAANAITTGKILDGTILGADMDFTGVSAATTGLVMVDSTGKFVKGLCSTVGQVATWTATGWDCQAVSTPSLADGKIWIGVSGTATAATMSGDATISNSGTLTLKNTGTAGTYYKVTTDAQGRVSSGSTSLAASDIPSLPWSKITSGTPTTLAGYGITDAVQNGGGTPSITTGLSSAKPAAGVSGAVFIETDTQNVYSGTGSGWLAIGGSTGSITALTGDVTASGSGSVAATIANSAVTNAKMANMAATTLKGNATGSAAAPTDITIASLQGTTSSTFAAGNDSRITGALQSGATAGGDLSGTLPSPTVAKIQGTGVSITSLTSGDFLKYNGSNWVNSTISSSNLSDGSSLIKSSQMPANCSAGETLTFSSPTGSWVCSAIVVTASNFSSQTANTFLAAPNGSAGTPTFRTIASADLPITGSSGVYVNGGNSFGAAATLGTNDSNTLGFKTNGTTSMTLDTSGNLGIGTATPQGPLDVQGGTNSSGAGLPINLVAQSANASTSNAGGSVNITGGAASALSSGKLGGSITLTGGTGAFISGGLPLGRGGGVSLIGGTGGTGSASNGAPGGLITITGGTGGAGTNTGATGGGVTITGGTGAGTNSSGGAVSLSGGAPNGTGSYGTLVMQSSGGYVTIGTGTPSASKVTVAGSVVSTTNSISSGATVDLATSNVAVLASVGGSTITLSNMANGGNYTLVIQDTTSRTYTFSGCNTSKFLPPNGPTVSGAWSTYNILTIYNGTTYDCLVTWASGYQ